MADEDNEYTCADAGSSKTFPMQASALRKNGYCMLKNRPCKIVEMSTSKTGKHGHAKVNIVGIDIFTSKKYEDITPSTHNMDVPHVGRQDYQVTDCDEDSFVTLMDDEGNLREDLKLTGDIGKEVISKFKNEEEIQVTVIKAIDEEQIVAIKPISTKGK